MSDKSAIPLITNPSGGGAMQGIGEKFTPDLFTGTGNYSIPIEVPAGRNGFQPQLSLVYSTGSGNSPFGMGWSLSVPSVERKTSKGVPTYDDEADVFMLSGSDDLVPVDLERNITRYRPRTEAGFSRIEHHREEPPGLDYWKVRNRDGTINLYGCDSIANTPEVSEAVVRDPQNADRRYSWKLTEARDPFGNRISFEYLRDDVRVDGPHQWDQVYLSRIQYVDYGDVAGPNFLVQVRFHYEDRPDPFSDYRAGFEIRTMKRCQRIEIWTNADKERRVRTYHLTYLDDLDSFLERGLHNRASLLAEIRVQGHDDETNQSQFLPPLRLNYGTFSPEKHKFKAITGPELPPGSLGQPNLEIVDLFGNGLPDILELREGVARFWRNLGDGRLDRPRSYPEPPAGLSLDQPGVRLIDADGDGCADLVVTQQGLSGYYPLTYLKNWDLSSFRKWDVAPTFSFDDPESRFIDLTGDGVTDLLRTGTRFECYYNDSEKGWHDFHQFERKSFDDFPNVSFSDSRAKLADMTGDGLTDIVLVHDGHIDYWPSMGRGNFARRIRMRNSPQLPVGYDLRRCLIGDVDGDGVADFVYIDDHRLLLWINQSGNSWSEPIEILGTPPVSDLDSVRLVDFLGTGVAGILWTRDAATAPYERISFLDFTGGRKPYLLERIDNCMGAVTRVSYLPSTRFYLDDLETVSKWKTNLPFPVQVVSGIESIDQISDSKLSTEYAYHHGYWDGVEREFRGFGRVDRRDSESIEDFHVWRCDGDDRQRILSSVDPPFFSPPTETRSWFCLGPIGDEFSVPCEADFQNEFWAGDPSTLTPSCEISEALAALPSLRTRRDAHRALRGRLLRTELYCLDGTARAARPYTVTERLHDFRPEVASSDRSGVRSVFFPFLIAERTTQWDRSEEPLTKLSFNGDYDPYGQPRLQLDIAVPRGRDYNDRSGPSANPFLATYTVVGRAQRDDATAYIVDRIAHKTTFSVVDDGRVGGTDPRPSALELWTDLLRWKSGSGSEPNREVIAQFLCHYDGNNFEGLPLMQIGVQGAAKRIEELVFTEAILHEGYRSGASIHSVPEAPVYFVASGSPAWSAEYPDGFRATVSRMQHPPLTGTPLLGGFVFHGGDAIRLRGFYSATAQRAYGSRGLITAERDPLGNETQVSYTDGFDFLPTKVTDPQTLQTSAVYNYRVLQPELVTDPNGNETAYAFTPLGLLEAVAVLGKPALSEGDTKAEPGTTFTYDFDAFRQSGQPVYTHTKRRTHHVTDPDDQGQFIETREFSDGFGRLLQTRTVAEDVLYGNLEFGDDVLPLDQARNSTPVARVRSHGTPPNVVVSGWQRFDNKGRVIEKYEPFFSEGWDYRPVTDHQKGQKSTTFYDARGRIFRTVNPDDSEQLTIFGIPADISLPDEFCPSPWEQYKYDANDNAGRTHFGDPSVSSYAAHFDTPNSMVVDALGRIVEQVERNGANASAEWYTTRYEYDIRGNLLKVSDQLGRLAFDHVYDLSGRRLRTEQLDSGAQRMIYDATGEMMERRDAKGALTLRATDKLLRPTHLWARDGSAQPVTLRERIIYGDDAQSSGLSGGQALARNCLGKPFRHYDEAGLIVFEAYDCKGNLVEKSRRVISDIQILATFTSASTNNWNVQAYRVDWRPAAGTTLDARASTILDTTVHKTTQEFDALGRVKRIRYPMDVSGARRLLELSYNQGGSLEHALFDGQTFVEHITYNAKGQRTLIAYGDRDPAKPGPRVMTRYAYDPKTFRLARMRSEKFGSSASSSFTPRSSALQDLAYDYDLAGNLVAVHDRAPGSGTPSTPDQLDRVFTYDPLYRLRSATGRECDTPLSTPWDPSPRCHDVTRTRPYTHRYRYDAAGNMKTLEHHISGGTALSSRNFELAQGTNRLETVRIGAAVHRYHYDAAGNLVQENTERHLEWDHGNRLRVFRVQTAGAEPSQHAHYLYDASGQRIKKLMRKQGGLVQVTVYVDDVFELHNSVTGANAYEHNTLHIMDAENRIGTVRVGQDPSDNTPRIKFHLGDHLGNSSIVIGQDGGWINREEYTPYGETSFGCYYKKRYRNAGMERDEESGLAYHGARYFVPWLLRWATTDPVGAAGGLNQYSFSNNSPLRWWDNRGKQPAEKNEPGIQFHFSTWETYVEKWSAGFDIERIISEEEAESDEALKKIYSAGIEINRLAKINSKIASGSDVASMSSYTKDQWIAAADITASIVGLLAVGRDVKYESWLFLGKPLSGSSIFRTAEEAYALSVANTGGYLDIGTTAYSLTRASSERDKIMASIGLEADVASFSAGATGYSRLSLVTGLIALYSSLDLFARQNVEARGVMNDVADEIRRNENAISYQIGQLAVGIDMLKFSTIRINDLRMRQKSANNIQYP